MSPSSGPPGYTDAIRVLHVDDELDIIEITRQSLEVADPAIIVNSCSSLENVLEELEKEHYDCVVSDYQMNGSEAIELAETIHGGYDIPVLMYTGRGSEEVAEAAFEAGFDDYIRKEAGSSHYQILARRIRAAVEKKRAETGLRESEERFRSLFESTYEGVMVSGPDGRYISANPAAAEILGYGSPDEIIGLSAVDFYAVPERRDEFFEVLRERGYVTDYEHEVKRKDGLSCFISANVTLHRDEEGEILRTEVFFRDITHRKRIEEELRESEARLRLFMDSATDGFSLLDSEFNIIDINRSRVEMTSSPRESLLGKNILDLYPYRDISHKIEIYRRVLETGNPETFSDMSGIPFVEERQILVNVFKVGDGLGISTTNISEMQQLEERLRESETLYRELAERSIDVIYRVDLEGRIIYISPSIEELAGHTQEEVTGKPFLNYLSPDVQSSVEAAIGEAIEGRQVQRYLMEVLRKDGSSVTVEVNSSQIFEHGNFVGFQGILRDVTERSRLEHRLEVLHNHAAELGEADSLAAIAETTLRVLDETLGYQIGSLCINTGSSLDVRFGIGVDPWEVFELPLEGRGVTVRALKTRSTQIVQDTRLDPDYVAGPERALFEIRSEIDVPVIVDGEVAVVLNANSTEPNAITEKDRKLIETLAIHVTSAISRMRQIDSIRESSLALEKSEANYRRLLESSPDPILVFADDKVEYINPRGVELLGYSETSELIGKESRFLLAPEFREMALDRGRRRRAGEDATRQYELAYLRKDGSKLDVEVNVSRIEYEGKPASLVFVRDITERKTMEDELRESEERYRSLVELSPDVIMTFNFKGFVTSTNRAIEKLSGYSPDELVGRHFSKLGYFRAQDIPRYTRIVSSIIRGRIPSPIEFPYNHKDGTPKWAEAHVGYNYKKGKRVGVQCVVIDITDRKIVEEELREHASSLEELVKKRSQELVEAEKMVTAGKIASMVGHDLRGPLSLIKNSLSLIESRPEMFPELKASIDNSVDHALNMLEELRFSTRTVAPLLVETNLENLTSRAIGDARIPSSIRVGNLIGESVGMVCLDSTQFRRVLDNLIRNSVEAMPEGGELKIVAGREDDEVFIEVADTGSGIPDEFKPDLFKAFATTKPKGIGLGLTYCKRAVEAHGGSIAVESKEGEGTSFKITLPYGD